MKLSNLFETPASMAYEQSLAEKFQALGGIVWAEPKGDDAGWPDVGVTFKLPSGNLHVHVEAKMKKQDPMGSLRKWTFNGNNFSAVPPIDDNQQLILGIMNNSVNLKDRSNLLFQLLQQYFHPDITEISSGALSVIKDTKERYKQTVEFVKKAKGVFGGTGNNFQLTDPKINDPRIGSTIIKHYKNKFTPLPNGDNIIMFVMGNEMFIVSPVKVKPQVYNEFLNLLKLSKIETMPTAFEGSLEVRVQVRHLSKEGKVPTSLDVMATLRAPGLSKIRGTPLK